MDLTRFGASDGPPDWSPGSSLDDQLDDLATVLGDAGLTSATFIGISGGATLLLAMAIRYPAMIEAGLAHEPLIGALAPALHAEVSNAMTRMDESPSPKAVCAYIADLIGVDTWNHLAPAWRDAVEANAAVTRAEAPVYTAFSPTAAQLAALAGRRVVTSVGSRSGPVRHETAATLRRFGLSSPVVPEAGHLASIEAPDAFADLIDTLSQQAGAA